MIRQLRALVSLGLCMVFGAWSGLNAQAAAPPQIVSAGEGEASAVPDRATLYVGVQSRAPNAATAAADNARRQKAVLDTLRALGLGASQLSTANYSVAPEMQYDRADGTARVVRYVVNNTVRAEVLKLEDLGRLLDAVLARGANQVSGLEFYSSSVDESRRRALADAVAKARADAEAVARAAGGTLGTLIEITIGSAPMRPMDMMLKAAATATTPIEPGSQIVRASVVGRWLFVPGR